MRKPQRFTAWLWEFPRCDGSGRWVRCDWTWTTKRRLLEDGKPTDDARMVRVEVRVVPPKKRKGKRKGGRK